jgi:hypothetical protein
MYRTGFWLACCCWLLLHACSDSDLLFHINLTEICRVQIDAVCIALTRRRPNLVLRQVVALARANFLVGLRIDLDGNLASTGSMGVFEL